MVKYCHFNLGIRCYWSCFSLDFMGNVVACRFHLNPKGINRQRARVRGVQHG